MSKFNFPKITFQQILDSPGGSNMRLGIEKDESENLLITGCAGSGKTTVALWRVDSWEKRKINTIFFVYNNLLKTYLQNASFNYPQEKICSFYKWYWNEFRSYFNNDDDEVVKNNFNRYVEKNGKFDAIAVDEGQDLPDKFYKNINNLTNHITICADGNQRANEDGVLVDNVIDILDVFHIELTHNFRNTKEIYDFAKRVLPDNEIVNQENYTIDTRSDIDSVPIIYKCKNEEEENNRIIDIIQEYKDSVGGIVIALDKKDKIRDMYNFLVSKKIECSMHHSEEKITEFVSPLVTTYKSIRGLEFDVVIVPKINNDYFGEREDLYAVLTRAKERLFIIDHLGLPEHIRNISEDYYNIF